MFLSFLKKIKEKNKRVEIKVIENVIRLRRNFWMSVFLIWGLEFAFPFNTQKLCDNITIR